MTGTLRVFAGAGDRSAKEGAESGEGPAASRPRLLGVGGAYHWLSFQRGSARRLRGDCHGVSAARTLDGKGVKATDVRTAGTLPREPRGPHTVGGASGPALSVAPLASVLCCVTGGPPKLGLKATLLLSSRCWELPGWLGTRLPPHPGGSVLCLFAQLSPSLAGSDRPLAPGVALWVRPSRPVFSCFHCTWSAPGGPHSSFMRSSCCSAAFPPIGSRRAGTVVDFIH